MKNPSQIIKEIKQDLPLDVQLVAVSKFHPSSMIEDAYAGGQRLFGENHVQELQQKHEVLPKDIEWHFIGHLQTNKVKYIAPYVHLIHAVDTHKLLQEINKQAEKNNRIIDCLLELHIAQEETKYGFSVDELYNYVKQGEWKQLNNVRICGLMCMASNVEDEAQIASEFQKAEKLFNTIKKEFFTQQDYFTIRSWGMSDDYPIAVKYGSNMVRIGSKIFGPRVC
ncbi:MAG: YggS family pyridoxal phosphate-dependent enzyme [Bacteroidaceae bacterium]|jgi:pyridoxal phosphate enzyme (YggS family)|nr:YggS family pyridoxal phosphate-dependent enzyme [Bacteroidaceae bacterium]